MGGRVEGWEGGWEGGREGGREGGWVGRVGGREGGREEVRIQCPYVFGTVRSLFPSQDYRNVVEMKYAILSP